MTAIELVTYHQDLAKTMCKRMSECTEATAREEFFQLVNFHTEAVELIQNRQQAVAMHPLERVKNYHLAAASHYRQLAMQSQCMKDDMLAFAMQHERFAQDCEEAKR